MLLGCFSAGGWEKKKSSKRHMCQKAERDVVPGKRKVMHTHRELSSVQQEEMQIEEKVPWL